MSEVQLSGDQPAQVPWKVVTGALVAVLVSLLVYVWQDARKDDAAAEASAQTQATKQADLAREVAAMKATADARYEAVSSQLGRIEDRLSEVVQWELEAHGQRSRVPMPGFSRDSQLYGARRR